MEVVCVCVCFAAAGPGDQGILFEYRSKEFGDHADPQEILAAARKIKSA